MIGRKKDGVGASAPEGNGGGGSFFDQPTTAGKTHKTKKQSTSNMFSRRAKVNTRRKQTPTQSAAIKATRLRSMVFAVAAVVIGVGTLVVVEAKPAPKTYTIYVLKTTLTAGQKVHPSEVTAETVNAPVPGLASVSMLKNGYLLANTYAGEILQQAMFTPGGSVPNGDVLIGLSMSSNAVPNAQLYTGEKVGIYSSDSNTPIVGMVNGTQQSYKFGQELTQATIVYAPTISSSSSGATLLDIAVPSGYAGLVSAAASNSQITIGVL